LPDDVKQLAPAALRHRVILSPAAEIDGRSVDAVIGALIEQVETPR
jgi:MoxR-like ATPase